MTKLALDPEKTTIRIRTFAEGLFSRLAHDLELVCHGVEGAAERTDEANGSASLDVPVAKIEVVGTLNRGRVDAAGLSPSDRHDVVRKMCREVFHTSEGTTAVVRIDVTLQGEHARIRMTPPNGRAVERSVVVRLEPEGKAGVRVSGSLDLSLDAIGSDPVKGPMNAFRVKDTVEILYDVAFSEAR